MRGSIYAGFDLCGVRSMRGSIYVIYRLLSYEVLPFICAEKAGWYFVMIRYLFASTQDNTRVIIKYKNATLYVVNENKNCDLLLRSRRIRHHKRPKKRNYELII